MNGFLFFTVLDVWGLILPLGLSLVLLGTLSFEVWRAESFNEGLSGLLLVLSTRIIIFFIVVSGLVGVIMPGGMGFEIPVSHLGPGPWGYEEIGCFLLATLCLGYSSKQLLNRGKAPLGMVGLSVSLLLCAGLLWVARWDMMANGRFFVSNLMLENILSWDWRRVLPKYLHLIFSSLVTGGLVVVGLGLFQWVVWGNQEKREPKTRSDVSSETIRFGVGWTLAGLVPQMVVGPWLFLVLGEGSRGVLIDGMGAISLVFFVSLTAYLLALVLLNATFMVPSVTGLAWGGLLSALTTLVLMGVVRYAMFGATTQIHHVPFAYDPITISQVGSVIVLIGLLLAILVRWCVWPLSSSSMFFRRLDK